MGKKKDQVPIATLDGGCVWVPSKDAAALTALERLPYDSREYSGAIYKNDKGEYCYSVPVPGDNDSFQFKIDKSGGIHVDGIYHTHPGHESSNDVFSMGDVAMADKLNKTSFIRANETGVVRRYDPGVSPKDNLSDNRNLRDRGKVSSGTSLGSLTQSSLADLIQALQPQAPVERPTQQQIAAQLLKQPR